MKDSNHFATRKMYSIKASLLFTGFILACAFEGIVNADQDADLKIKCRYANAWQNEYKDFFKITDLPGVRPKGYIVHLPFYVKAQRDAHVLLTSGPKAIREGNEYEIVIGGWGGSKTVIRRKQQSQQPLGEAYHSEIISGQYWAEYLLQITAQGKIKLFRKEDDGSYNLIVGGIDRNPLPVEYISFGSWNNNHVEFYFDCSFFSAITPEVVVDKTDVPDQDAECRYADTWQNEYKEFFKIADLPGVRPKGYIVHFPFYVRAQRDAHVLLTSGPKAIREDSEYEIVIGGWGGAQTVIRRKQQSQQPLAAVQHSEIISGQYWAEYLLQITTQGNIKLFRKEDNGLYKPIVEGSDPNPLPVEYISFGSWHNNHVEFHFDCPFFSAITPEVVEVVDITEQEAMFKKQCRYADAWHNEYKNFFKIRLLSDVRPRGYIAHFPFYVRAQRDAHVLLTKGPRAIRGDNEYEIVIGGWDGSKTVIRRKQQSQQPLGEAYHSGIISSQEWIQYLLQITTQGNIKLFRKEGKDSYRLIVEANDRKPLPVEYISFGSWNNNHVEFYFDCFSFDHRDTTFTKVSNILELEAMNEHIDCSISDDWC